MVLRVNWALIWVVFLSREQLPGAAVILSLEAFIAHGGLSTCLAPPSLHVSSLHDMLTDKPHTLSLNKDKDWFLVGEPV